MTVNHNNNNHTSTNSSSPHAGREYQQNKTTVHAKLVAGDTHVPSVKAGAVVKAVVVTATRAKIDNNNSVRTPIIVMVLQ